MSSAMIALMKIVNGISSSSSLCLLAVLLCGVSVRLGEAAEFAIYSNKMPSGLWHNFSEVTEKMFPAELSIAVVMARISGILVYRYDLLGNQLIVDLDGGNRPTIMVRFRSKRGPIYNIAQLCSCRRPLCLLEKLKFKIRISSSFSLSCNGGLETILLLSNSKNINTKFPVVSFPKSSSPNQATLWVGNHQQIGSWVPEDRQMTGCVLDVSYRGQTIDMTRFGEVKRGCARSCLKVGVCNGGGCVETYDNEEVRCDCSATTFSGTFCNESSPLQNKNYTFKANMRALKISVKSQQIWKFEMISGNKNISLYISGPNFIYELDRKQIVTPNKPNIVILEFRDEFLNLTMLPYEISYQIRATVKISKTNPTFIVVYSTAGHMNMSCKQQRFDENWEKLPEPMKVTELIQTFKEITCRNEVEKSEATFHCSTPNPVLRYTERPSSTTMNSSTRPSQHKGTGSGVYLGLAILVLFLCQHYSWRSRLHLQKKIACQICSWPEFNAVDTGQE